MQWIGDHIGIIITVVVLSLSGWGIYSLVTLGTSYECIKSHTEKQFEQPMSINTGGGKYGGGVNIPLGNIRQVDVTVCDDYQKKTK